ncbi:MAG: methyltransferase domain-containing protein [Planctomycetes bacterium]|nr:methyltransferase domain-containing protein [Planctomycetota bacterium]
MTIDSQQSTKTIQVRVTDPPLELFIADGAFRPNPTTVRFARTIRIDDGDVVFDIGTGIGPLAVMAAMAGAAEVHGVDPVPMHCELARRNVAKYGLEDRVHIHEGPFFEPLRNHAEYKDTRANVIIGDVSGIADIVARALGWYSSDVPTGGEDGTDVIIDLLDRARTQLTSGGTIYFPIAIDLCDDAKILDDARTRFATVVNAMERPTTNFPMTDAEVEAVNDAYDNHVPDYITIQSGRRPYWRGQIWKASDPR